MWIWGGVAVATTVIVGGILLWSRKASAGIAPAPPVEKISDPTAMSGYSSVTKAEMQKVQQQLTQIGLDPGKIDGKWKHGGNTYDAVLEFQSLMGLEPDGKPGPSTRATLQGVIDGDAFDPSYPADPADPSPTPSDPKPSDTSTQHPSAGTGAAVVDGWGLYTLCDLTSLNSDHPLSLGVPHRWIYSDHKTQLEQAVRAGRFHAEYGQWTTASSYRGGPLSVGLNKGLRASDIMVKHSHPVEFSESDLKALSRGESVDVRSNGPTDNFDSHTHNLVFGCEKDPGWVQFMTSD